MQHDSRAVQFIGSELYRRDIPLTEFAERSANPEKGGFSEHQLQNGKPRPGNLLKKAIAIRPVFTFNSYSVCQDR
jgi:hypothetical protein